MMNNLFSIFDTATSTLFNLNWLSSISNLMLLPSSYWLTPSKFIFIYNKLVMMLHNELKMILLNKFNLFNSIYLISLIIFIFINNFLGLFPYIFTSSSHLIFSMSICLPMWLSFLMMSIFKNIKFFFIHLIPEGTPIILMPFMTIIETISILIRPLTLTIRLTANMIAGHLLITLLSQTVNTSNFIISVMIIFTQIILLILEYSVAMIQSYVFMILSTLYLKETNYEKIL